MKKHIAFLKRHTKLHHAIIFACMCAIASYVLYSDFSLAQTPPTKKIESMTSVELAGEGEKVEGRIEETHKKYIEETKELNIQTQEREILEEKRDILTKIISQWKKIEKLYKTHASNQKKYDALKKKNDTTPSRADTKTQESLEASLVRSGRQIDIRLRALRKYYDNTSLSRSKLNATVIKKQLKEPTEELALLKDKTLPDKIAHIKKLETENTETKKVLDELKDQQEKIETLLGKKKDNPLLNTQNTQVTGVNNSHITGTNTIYITGQNTIYINGNPLNIQGIIGNNGVNMPMVTYEGLACGNGIKEGTEACDDGNNDDTDSCSNSCTIRTPEIRCRESGTACETLTATLGSPLQLGGIVYALQIPLTLTLSGPTDTLRENMFTCSENTTIVPCVIRNITSTGDTYAFEVLTKKDTRFSIQIGSGKLGKNGFKNKASNVLTWTAEGVPTPTITLQTPLTTLGLISRPIFIVSAPDGKRYPVGTTLTLHDRPTGGDILGTTVLDTESQTSHITLNTPLSQKSKKMYYAQVTISNNTATSTKPAKYNYYTDKDIVRICGKIIPKAFFQENINTNPNGECVENDFTASRLGYVPGGQVKIGGIATGEGTIQDPYRICTMNQLANMGSQYHYILGKNLDSKAEENNGNTGMRSRSVKSFNGNGYTISNLSMDASGSATGALFSDVECGIFDLRLRNVKIRPTVAITERDSVSAILVSTLGKNATLANISIIGDSGVRGSRITGGLVGQCSENCSIHTSINEGKVSGTEISGGIVGQMNVGKLDQVINRGEIISSTTTAGGLVGLSMSRSYGAQSHIIDSYNTGSVSSGHLVGGILGKSENTIKIDRVYNAGKVTVTSPSTTVISGGIGGGVNTTLSNSFTVGTFNSTNKIQVIGANSTAKNILYHHSPPLTCTNISPRECRSIPDITSFYGNTLDTLLGPDSGWDFTNIWKINTGKLPTLQDE